MTHPMTTYAGAELGREVCRAQTLLTQGEIDRFCGLLGYDGAQYQGVAPTSMCLAFGLRLGWEAQVFPPGVIRVGDENTYGVPAQVGEVLVTTLVITDRFERKGRRFLTYQMDTTNPAGEQVCRVKFTAIIPDGAP